MVFAEPIAGPALRRETKQGPLRGEAIGGLLLAIEPQPGTTQDLARLGFAAELTAADGRVLAAAYSGPLVS